LLAHGADLSSPPLEAARFSFPHTGALHGGCIPGTRFGLAWYCPDCRAAARDWPGVHRHDGRAD
jgi:hypothetical protein